MSIVQFSHANGFPASTYQVLFNQLPELQFHAIEQLGGSPKQLNRNFENIVDELVADIEGRGDTSVIGMGHSLGGVVTLMAAGRRPDLFSQVILLDPPFFSTWKRAIIHGSRILGFGDRLGPVQKSKVRRDRFVSRDEAREYFGAKPFFQRFHSQAFQDYLTHGLVETEEGEVTLAISREMESEIFRTIHPGKMQGIEQVKGTIIYGAQSDLIWPSDRHWWNRNLSHLDRVSIEGGHLFPLERPQATAEMIRKVLKSANEGK